MGVLAIASRGEPVRVTAITKPVLCRGDHQEINMNPVYRVIAGIDVHKTMLAVVVRRGSEREAGYEQRQFGTTKGEIQHLRAWLLDRGVQEAVLESTAQY